jgi:hypothetical protein
MPRVTIRIGGRERLEATIGKATPMGLLDAEAIVRLGSASITASATALRVLADALVEAADLADDFDAPDAFHEREQAEAEPDR